MGKKRMTRSERDSKRRAERDSKRRAECEESQEPVERVDANKQGYYEALEEAWGRETLDEEIANACTILRPEIPTGAPDDISIIIGLIKDKTKKPTIEEYITLLKSRNSLETMCNNVEENPYIDEEYKEITTHPLKAFITCADKYISYHNQPKLPPGSVDDMITIDELIKKESITYKEHVTLITSRNSLARMHNNVIENTNLDEAYKRLIVEILNTWIERVDKYRSEHGL